MCKLKNSDHLAIKFGTYQAYSACQLQVNALYDHRIGDITSCLIFFVRLGVRRSITFFSGVTRSMASVALFTSFSIKICASASVLGPLS